MAEWNLFQIDSARPEREPLARFDAEVLVADKIIDLLSTYGTKTEHVEVNPDEDSEDEDDPWIERYTILDFEAMLQGDSALYIGQLPIVGGETITDRGTFCLDLTDHSGNIVLRLAVLNYYEEELGLTVVTSEEVEPDLEHLSELVDALDVIGTQLIETHRANNHFADPQKYPRLERPLHPKFCRAHAYNNDKY